LLQLVVPAVVVVTGKGVAMVALGFVYDRAATVVVKRNRIPRKSEPRVMRDPAAEQHRRRRERLQRHGRYEQDREKIAPTTSHGESIAAGNGMHS